MPQKALGALNKVFAMIVCAAVSGLIACEDMVSPGHMPLKPGAPSLNEVEYYDPAPGDSSPAACSQMQCTSLSTTEKNDLMYLAAFGMQAASNAGDGDCFLVWRDAWTKVANNYVFHMNADIRDANNNEVLGAYNAGHGEIYVRNSRFASTGDLLNTLGHETTHSWGKHDPGVAGATYPYPQDYANWCTIYF